MSEENNLILERADLYMGIGQAIQHLRKAQDELIRFGVAPDVQLKNGQSLMKDVIDYLNSDNLYRFQDLCVSEEKP